MNQLYFPFRCKDLDKRRWEQMDRDLKWLSINWELQEMGFL